MMKTEPASRTRNLNGLNKCNIKRPVFFLFIIFSSISCVQGKQEIIPVRSITPRMWHVFAHESGNPDSAKHRNFFDKPHYGDEPSPGFYPIGGVVSHHTLAGGLLYDYFRQISGKCENINSIIIIGPDHFLKAGEYGIAITTRDFSWNGNLVPVNRTIVTHWLEKLAINADHFPFYSEHSIAALIPFIAHFFPDAKLIPIILNPQADRQRLLILSRLINSFLIHNKQKTLLFISTDFCHNLTRMKTDANDNASMEIIYQLKKGSLAGITCDSPNSWFVALTALDDFEKQVQLVYHTDSGRYSGLTSDAITSYFFAIMYTKD